MKITKSDECHFAKALGLMEGEVLKSDRTPGEIMRRICFVRALEAVSAYLFTLIYLELGEKSAYKLIREFVCNFPAAFKFCDLAVENIFIRIGNKSDKIGNSRSYSEVVATDSVIFKIKISGIAFHGAEEEFKA